MHDDVSPIDAPRRASWRPGLYLSHVPGIPRLDVRVKPPPPIHPSPTAMAATSCTTNSSSNKATPTRANSSVTGLVARTKAARAGLPITSAATSGSRSACAIKKPPRTLSLAAQTSRPPGTTLNDISFQVVKRIGKDFEVNGNFAYERWKAPIYLSGQQTVTTTTIQLTWFPQRKGRF